MATHFPRPSRISRKRAVEALEIIKTIGVRLEKVDTAPLKPEDAEDYGAKLIDCASVVRKFIDG